MALVARLMSLSSPLRCRSSQVNGLFSRRFLPFALAAFAAAASSSSPPNFPTLDTDVAIVGAGYAGLTAARLLRAQGVRVQVLEATNTSGGRTKNWDLTPGNEGPDRSTSKSVELGGQWIGNRTVQRHAWELIVEDLGFGVFDASYTHGGGNSILACSDGLHNFTSMVDMLRKFPSAVRDELTAALEELDANARQLSLASPWTAPLGRQWDSETFTSWINRTVAEQESRTVLQALCTTMIAQSADVVSFLHILFYIRAAGGLHNLVVGEQQYRVVGGTQAPPLRMAAELARDGVIHYSSPVTLIEHGGSGSSTVYVTPRGAPSPSLAVRAKYVILTGPPPMMRYIEFDPTLPYAKHQLFERLPLGNSVKAQLVYPDGPFWRKQGWSGTVMASQPALYDGAKNPLLSNCMDNTPHAGTPGVMLCFLEGETSIIMMEWTHEERQRYIAEWIGRFFGPKEALNFSLLLDFNWAAQPYEGGAYSSYFPTGVWSQMGEALRTPVGRLYWAGADYAEEGFG